jgi:lysozyme
MSRKAIQAARGAAILAAFLLFWGASRASVRQDATSYDPAIPIDNYPEPMPWEPINMPDPQIAYTDEDLMSAFLAVIRRAEVGGWDDARRYTTFYGGAQFSDLSDHPVATKEMRGVRLPDAFCRAAGFAPGCVSTAAGAYQFILPTWQRMRAAGAGSPRLPDFSPASQDEAARRLLERIGAAQLLRAGDVEGAILKAGEQWASLPGSRAGQPQKSMATVTAWFAEALESIAG